VDIFFFQLVIIFIPGIVWERVDTQYGRERAKEQWMLSGGPSSSGFSRM